MHVCGVETARSTSLLRARDPHSVAVNHPPADPSWCLDSGLVVDKLLALLAIAARASSTPERALHGASADLRCAELMVTSQRRIGRPAWSMQPWLVLQSLRRRISNTQHAGSFSRLWSVNSISNCSESNGLAAVDVAWPASRTTAALIAPTPAAPVSPWQTE
jgi:hypothetical protein